MNIGTTVKFKTSQSFCYDTNEQQIAISDASNSIIGTVVEMTTDKSRCNVSFSVNNEPRHKWEDVNNLVIIQ